MSQKGPHSPLDTFTHLGAKRLEHRRLITTVHASLSGCWGLTLEGNLVSSLFFILGAKDPDDF